MYKKDGKIINILNFFIPVETFAKIRSPQFNKNIETMFPSHNPVNRFLSRQSIFLYQAQGLQIFCLQFRPPFKGKPSQKIHPFLGTVWYCLCCIILDWWSLEHIFGCQPLPQCQKIFLIFLSLFGIQKQSTLCPSAQSSRPPSKSLLKYLFKYTCFPPLYLNSSTPPCIKNMFTLLLIDGMTHSLILA